jgi:hypothetical protein
MLFFPRTCTSSRALESSAIPYYEHAVSAALSGGVVSVSDANRARTAGAASGKSVDHIAPGRGPESLYMLWMEAEEPGWRHCCCLLRMTVPFAANFTTSLSSSRKDSTEAKYLADIADLVDTCGGEGLVARYAWYPLESINPESSEFDWALACES